MTISGNEVDDRLQINDLIDAYAHCADRRDVKGQMSLFTEDVHFVVFMDARSNKPSMEFNRREDLAPVFDELNKYEVTTHFIGQSTVILDGERATGETYCIAHHVSESEGKRILFIASIRYYDVFAKIEGKWLFAERKLIVAGRIPEPWCLIFSCYTSKADSLISLIYLRVTIFLLTYFW